MITCCSPPVLPDERLDSGVARLAARFRPNFSPETVRELLADSYWHLASTARVHDHLVILAERLTRERLDALTHLQTAPGSASPRVLFVCGHNAGRSQIAAALLTSRTGGRVAVSSAGTHPAPEVDLAVMEVMLEIGVDLTTAYPKPLTEEIVSAVDIVITLGCGDVCPVAPGRRYLNWPVADPVGASTHRIRRIRDELDIYITGLLDTIETR